MQNVIRCNVFVICCCFMLLSFCMEVQAGEIYNTGFESGSLGSGQNGFSWGNGVNTTISSENPKSGSYSLKLRFPPGNYAGQRFNLGANYPDIWIKYDLYIPQNHTSELIISRDWLCPEPECGGGKSNKAITESDRGHWMTIVWHGKRASIANNDGVAEMWKTDWQGDTNKLIDVHEGDRCVTKPNSTGSNRRFDKGYLLGWVKSGSVGETVLYVDNITFSTTSLLTNEFGGYLAAPTPPMLFDDGYSTNSSPVVEQKPIYQLALGAPKKPVGPVLNIRDEKVRYAMEVIKFVKDNPIDTYKESGLPDVLTVQEEKMLDALELLETIPVSHGDKLVRQRDESGAFRTVLTLLIKDIATKGLKVAIDKALAKIAKYAFTSSVMSDGTVTGQSNIKLRKRDLKTELGKYIKVRMDAIPWQKIEDCLKNQHIGPVIKPGPS